MAVYISLKERNMEPKTKKWLNRGGAIALIAGYLTLKFTGTDPEAVISLGDIIFSTIGVLTIGVKELFNRKTSTNT